MKSIKTYVIVVLIAFVALWLAAIAVFSGAVSQDVLPAFMSKLEQPASFALLGEAMGTLDGLFSSIAIVLGLVAIFFQGSELKTSTDAQTLQAKALTLQIAQQNASNQLTAFTARLNYLASEIAYMENAIPKMVENANLLKEKNRMKECDDLWTIIKNTREKQQRYRKQADEIDDKIQHLLQDFE